MAQDLKSCFLLLAIASLGYAAATCPAGHHFPYVFGMNTTHFETAQNTVIRNYAVIPSTSEVVVEVLSNSKRYFFGGLDDGTEQTYTGVIKMASDSHTILFKRGFSKNVANFSGFAPSIMALSQDESSVALIYSDKPAQQVQPAGTHTANGNLGCQDHPARIAFRRISAATGDIEKDTFSVYPKALCDFELIKLNNKMAVFKDDFLYFYLFVKINGFPNYYSIFFRVDMQPGRSLHMFRATDAGSKITLMKPIIGTGTFSNCFQLVSAGAAILNSGTHGLLIIQNGQPTVGPTVTTTDHAAVYQAQDQATGSPGNSGKTNFLEIGGLIAIWEPASLRGYIQAVATPSCTSDYGISATCSSTMQSKIGTIAVALFEVDLDTANNFINFSKVAGPMEMGSSNTIVVLDGAFLGLQPHFNARDAIWLFKTYVPILSTWSLCIYRIVNSATSGQGLGYAGSTITFNGDSTWLQKLSPVMGLNLEYFQKRPASAVSPNFHIFLGINTILSGSSDWRITDDDGLIFKSQQGFMMKFHDVTTTSCIPYAFSLATSYTHPNPVSNFFNQALLELTPIVSPNDIFVANSDDVWEHSVAEAEGPGSTVEIPEAERNYKLSEPGPTLTYCKVREQATTPALVPSAIASGVWSPNNEGSYLLDPAWGHVNYVSIIEEPGSLPLAKLQIERLYCQSGSECSSYHADACGDPLVTHQDFITITLENQFFDPQSPSVIQVSAPGSHSKLQLQFEPQASYTRGHLRGIHVITFELLLDPISGFFFTFPIHVKNQKRIFEVLPNHWPTISASGKAAICADEIYFKLIAKPPVAISLSNYKSVPNVFFTHFSTSFYLQIPIHKYALSCQVEDFRMLIMDKNGNWVPVLDGWNQAAVHPSGSDAQKISTQFMAERITGIARSTEKDYLYDWLRKGMDVSIIMENRVKKESGYSGFLVEEIRQKFTHPADKFINSVSKPVEAQAYMRKMVFKFQPKIQGNYVPLASVGEQEVLSIFCGDNLQPSAASEAAVEASYETSIKWNWRVNRHVLKVDLSSLSSYTYYFDGHEFLTDAQSGEVHSICQDENDHGLGNEYFSVELDPVSKIEIPAITAPLAIVELTSPARYQQELIVSYNGSNSIDQVGPITTRFKFDNQFRGGEIRTVKEVDIWVCKSKWLPSGSTWKITQPSSYEVQVGSEFTRTVVIGGLPSNVVSSAYVHFLFVNTSSPTTKATLVKTPKSAEASLKILISDTSLANQAMEIEFEAVSCFGERVFVGYQIQIRASIVKIMPTPAMKIPIIIGHRISLVLGQLENTFLEGQLRIEHELILPAPTTPVQSELTNHKWFLKITPSLVFTNGATKISCEVDTAGLPDEAAGASFKINYTVSSISDPNQRDSLVAEYLLVQDTPVTNTTPVINTTLNETQDTEVNSTNSTTEVVPQPEPGEEIIQLKGIFFVYKPQPKQEEGPPTYSFFHIDSSGQTNMTFDQPMMRPLDIARLDYSRIFKFRIRSVLDGSETEGQWVPSVSSTRRALESDLVAPQELGFTWQVTCWEVSTICFKLDFSTPKNVSSTAFGRDTLGAYVLDPSYLLSASTLKYVEASPAPTELSVRPQNLDPQVKSAIESAVAVVSAVGNTAGTSNLLIFYLLGASKQKLWSLMNAMQTIIYSTMADLNLPAHTSFFFQQVFEFAKMDVFSTEEVFAEVGMRETEPLSPQFEEAGFETKNFLINQGSFLVFFTLGVVEFISRLGLTWLCVRLARFRLFRLIGVRIDNPTLGATLFRLVMQTYIDIFICVALQSISISETGWVAHFQTPQDSLNTVAALVTVLIVLVFPVYSFLWLRANRENLSEEDEHGNYWPLYENVRLQSLGPAMYHILFIARRICIVCLLIFSIKINVFQAIGFLSLSAVNLAYLIGWKPFFNPGQNRQEVRNEIAVYLASHTIFALLNSATPPEFRSYMGWVLVFICSLSILYNLYFVLADLGWILQSEIRRFSRIIKGKSAENMLQSELEAQLKILTRSETDRDVNERIAAKYKLDNLKQRQLHDQWAEERDWCRRHSVDISSWPIEQEYIRKGRAINFFGRLQLEKRAEVERENAAALRDSKRFDDMMKHIRAQVKKQSVFQSRFNRLLQWLFDVEARGRLTKALEQEGRDLGAIKSSRQYMINYETGHISFSTKQFSKLKAKIEPIEHLSEQQVNYLICMERLRLLRESDPTDGFMSLLRDCGGKDAMNRILEIIHSVFTGFNIHACPTPDPEQGSSVETEPILQESFVEKPTPALGQSFKTEDRSLELSALNDSGPASSSRNFGFIKKQSGVSTVTAKTRKPFFNNQMTLPFEKSQEQLEGDSFNQGPPSQVGLSKSSVRSSIHSARWSSTSKSKKKKFKRKKKKPWERKLEATSNIIQ